MEGRETVPVSWQRDALYSVSLERNTTLNAPKGGVSEGYGTQRFKLQTETDRREFDE